MSPRSALRKNPSAAGKLCILAGLFAVVAMAFLLSVGVGAYTLSPGEVLRAIFLEREGLARSIVWNVRLPRVLIGALAGVCLALAGCILQGVMRNPLASPSTIGVTSGAGLAATICLVLLPGQVAFLTPAAFLGAMATTGAIYLLSWKNGIQPLRMVLAGLAVSSFVGAFVNGILIFYPDRVQNTLGFTVGSLAAKSWGEFGRFLPYVLLGSGLALLLGRTLNLLALGDELAASLGESPERSRFLCICVSSLLSASAVAVVGLLGFVGLIVPHMMRLIIGSDFRYLLPASALGGAALVMVCDTAARMVAPPIEIPVGILIAVLGAPFFLYLLRGRLQQDD